MVLGWVEVKTNNLLQVFSRAGSVWLVVLRILSVCNLMLREKTKNGRDKNEKVQSCHIVDALFSGKVLQLRTSCLETVERNFAMKFRAAMTRTSRGCSLYLEDPPASGG